MNLTTIMFWSHYLACSFMVGVIWYVQIVHYPLFHHIGASDFAHYETLHRAKTTLVVAAPMLIEAFTAVALIYSRPSWLPGISAWVGLGLVGVIWLATVVVSIPAHAKLSLGYDAQVTQHLVFWNWLRTVAWTVRWGGLTAYLMRALN